MVRKSGAGRKSGKSSGRGKAGPPILRMTSEEALAFIRKVQKKFPKPPRTKAEKAAVQKYVAQFGRTVLKAVGSRVQGDLMLRPPRTIRPEDFEKGRRRPYVSRRRSK